MPPRAYVEPILNREIAACQTGVKGTLHRPYHFIRGKAVGVHLAGVSHGAGKRHFTRGWARPRQGISTWSSYLSCVLGAHPQRGCNFVRDRAAIPQGGGTDTTQQVTSKEDQTPPPAPTGVQRVSRARENPPGDPKKHGSTGPATGGIPRGTPRGRLTRRPEL